MINFILVDDNDNHRKKVNNMIVSKMMNNKIEFKVYQFSDYSNELLKFIRLNKEDCIYILDLELPNGDGIDIARMIRNDTNNWINPIIILTAHSSLYYEVYKQRLQILDFIGKCEDVKTNLSENIDICLRMLNKDKVYRYTYKSIDYTIPLNHINYIQQYKINELGKQSIDFYLTDFNIAIECQGEQHFTIVDFSGHNFKRAEQFYKLIKNESIWLDDDVDGGE